MNPAQTPPAIDATGALFQDWQPCFSDYIALNGKWHKDKAAVIVADRVQTWGEFHQTTNQVANGLRALGIKNTDTIAVVMENSMEMMEVIWGIIKAGAVVVPANLSISDAALVAMLKNAKVRALFASASQLDRLENCRTQLTSLSPSCLFTVAVTRDGWQAYHAWRVDQSTQAPKVAIKMQQPCNIIYSSGTTGRPKGIVHTHLRRRDWALDLAVALRYHTSSVFLCTIGLYSNIVWAGMLPVILVGGTLVLARHFDPRQTLALIAEQRVTNTAMVPLQYQKLLAVDDLDAFDLKSLQALMSAGSPLWPGLKKALLQRFGKTIIELYGLTEGIITTLDPEQAERKPASVGKPLLGTDIRVIRADGTDCAIDEPGEVIGHGRIIMSGYYERPEETRDALLTDGQGRQWLKTGDIGKLDEEGYLYIVDRKKDMILSGGQNIYPADIEALMIRHSAIEDVAVIGIPHEQWGETPIALVVLKETENLETDALLAWVNAQLGRRQRLSALEIRASLPRNPNGKLLKKALRAPYWSDNRGST